MCIELRLSKRNWYRVKQASGAALYVRRRVGMFDFSFHRVRQQYSNLFECQNFIDNYINRFACTIQYVGVNKRVAIAGIDPVDHVTTCF